MYEKDGVWHCLLVAGEGMDEGVLVESEGSAYARYSAFVPFAQESSDSIRTCRKRRRMSCR